MQAGDYFRNAMTNAPADLLDLRHGIMLMTGVTDPVEIGIVGNDQHDNGYHLGVQTIKNRGNYPTIDYSTRQLRDRVGGDTASAMDVTLDWRNGGRSAAIAWSNTLAAHVKAGRIPEIRAINWMNTAGNKRRYDSFTGVEGSTTDTVDVHTHIEWWRNTEGHRDFTLLLNQNNVAPPPPVNYSQEMVGRDMIYQVSGVPAGALDATGAVLVNNGQCSATPHGPFNYTGTEFFSLPTEAQAVHMVITYPRMIALCNALSEKPATPQEIATAVAAQYPNNAIDQQVILDAITSTQGHAAFVAILETPEGQAALAEAATQGVRDL
jgi:hypothetical protein